MRQMVHVKPEDFDGAMSELFAEKLQPIVKRSGGRVSLDFMLQDCISGRCQPWVITDDGIVSSVVATRIVTYRGGRVVLRVDFASGDLGDAEDFIGTIERIAVENGCNAVRIEGRSGWQRALSGYREVSRILEKEI